jgi:predicted nucleic acid-binding protein
VSGQRRIRLFLDSNVLSVGIVSPWGLDKATLSLCAAKVCKLVLAEMVRDEVEENLLLHAERLPSIDADQLIDDYHRLIKLTNPELVPYPDKHRVRSSRNLSRHEAVPVLLSAIASKPDWLLTHNTKHFTQAVAQRTSLRTATPAEFFREFSVCSCKRWLRSPGQKRPSASESLRRKNSAYVPFLRESTYALETFTRE